MRNALIIIALAGYLMLLATIPTKLHNIQMDIQRSTVGVGL